MFILKPSQQCAEVNVYRISTIFILLVYVLHCIQTDSPHLKSTQPTIMICHAFVATEFCDLDR